MSSGNEEIAKLAQGLVTAIAMRNSARRDVARIKEQLNEAIEVLQDEKHKVGVAQMTLVNYIQNNVVDDDMDDD